MNGTGPRLVNKDVACLVAGIANEGRTTQGLLHHPLKVAAQVAVDEEDVHGPLVVGHEHVALVLVDVLTPLHVDGQQEYAAHEATPQTAGIVTPEVGVEKAANSRDKGRKGRSHKDERQGYEQLIEFVKHGCLCSRLFQSNP